MEVSLALSGDAWIALAGVASGAVVGLGGLVFAYFNGKEERVHAQRLARTSQIHEQRRLAYIEIARFLERQRLFLVRTHPIIGPKPDPPEPMGDDEWATVSGLASNFPSREVEAALIEAANRTNAFQAAVWLYQWEEEHGRSATGTDRSARLEMDEARDRATDAISQAQRAMSDELASL